MAHFWARVGLYLSHLVREALENQPYSHLVGPWTAFVLRSGFPFPRGLLLCREVNISCRLGWLIFGRITLKTFNSFAFEKHWSTCQKMALFTKYSFFNVKAEKFGPPYCQEALFITCWSTIKMLLFVILIWCTFFENGRIKSHFHTQFRRALVFSPLASQVKALRVNLVWFWAAF